MLNCLDCAKLKRENERLRVKVLRLKRLNDRIEEEIEFVQRQKEIAGEK